MLVMTLLERNSIVGSLEKGYQRSIIREKFLFKDPQDLARLLAYHIPVITRFGAGEGSSVPQDLLGYLLQGEALHHCLPNQDVARGKADWSALLSVDINQILINQNLLRLLPAGMPGRHRLRHHAFQVDRSLPRNLLKSGVPY